jgi:tetratricopeptide (TPR) repeat protein
VASGSSFAPIAPPAGVQPYGCEHAFGNPKAQALFLESLEKEGAAAQKLMRQVVKLEPNNASAFYHLSLACDDEVATCPEAVAASSRAIELQPGFAGAWNARAYARALMSDPKQWPLALEDVRRALGLEELPTYYDTRGYLLLRLGRPQEALDDVERAVREDAQEPDHLLHRAEVYAALGRLKEAERDRQQARKLRDS